MLRSMQINSLMGLSKLALQSSELIEKLTDLKAGTLCLYQDWTYSAKRHLLTARNGNVQDQSWTPSPSLEGRTFFLLHKALLPFLQA